MIEWIGFVALNFAAAFIMYLLGVIAHGHRGQKNTLVVIMMFITGYCVALVLAMLDIWDVVGNFGFFIAVPIILGLGMGWRKYPRLHDKRFGAHMP